MTHATVWLVTMCVLVFILLAVIVALAYIVVWQVRQAEPLDPPPVNKTWVDAYYEQDRK